MPCSHAEKIDLVKTGSDQVTMGNRGGEIKNCPPSRDRNRQGLCEGLKGKIKSVTNAHES